MTPEEHAAAVRAWRAHRDERLRSPDGWLTLVGLYWLEPGANSFGADPANPIMLSGSGVPSRAGSIRLEGDSARLEDASAEVRVGGRHVADAPLVDDRSADPTVLELGDLRMQYVQLVRATEERLKQQAAQKFSASDIVGKK